MTPKRPAWHHMRRADDPCVILEGRIARRIANTHFLRGPSLFADAAAEIIELCREHFQQESRQ